jgi:hypothetical protein
MIVAVVAVAMMVQTGGDPRTAYRSCLSDAVTSAKVGNVAADNFKAYAHNTCAAIEESFKSKLVTFNVRNGMSRKAAADDAQVQLDDYIYTYDEKYRYSVEPPK